ncbi:MAG TPA: peptide ABC transporter substrate-binding protein, partial [Opitutales bacterium]|nr:peptide ABC transporter substrate-binding protein [Opitutales bacterium]
MRSIGALLCRGLWLTYISTLLLCSYSCSKKQKLADAFADKQILLAGLPTEPESLDPHLLSGNAAISVVQGLLEGLVIPHPSDATQVLPGVAHAWECSDDGLCWTFYLRPQARWSNGDTVVASDFVYSYKRALDPKFAAPMGDTLGILKNAKQYQRGLLDDFNQVGVQTLDEQTLLLTLEHPAPYLLPSLTQCVWMPVHPPTIEAHGGPTNRLSDWTLSQHYVGNGPFNLKNWDPNHSIELEASNTYWDCAQVGLRGIHWQPYADQAAEERAFRAGQLHYCTRVPVGLIDVYRKEHPELLHSDPYFATYFFRINTPSDTLK